MSNAIVRLLAIACLVATTTCENATEASVAPAMSEPQIAVTELQLDENAEAALLQLDDEISRQDVVLGSSENQRAARHINNEQLSDAEIGEIIKMISFPTEAKEQVGAAEATQQAAGETAEVEPRELPPGSGARQGRGYYILAFEPVGENDVDNGNDNVGKAVPYSKIDIIPASPMQRSKKLAKAVLEADNLDNDEAEDDFDYNVPSYDDDYTDAQAENDDELDEEAEARFISMRQLSRYIRRLMRQLRRGTRKIKRKTKLKSLEEPPTVENFVKGLYRAQQKRKQAESWFGW